MKKNAIKLSIFVMILSFVFAYSCNVEDLLPPSTQTAGDCSVAEDVIADVFGSVNEATFNQTGLKSVGEACATITAVLNANDVTLTVNFGSGCVTKKGIKKGKLVAVVTKGWSNYFANPATVGSALVSMVVTFDQFSSEGKTLSGKIKYEFKGFEAGVPKYVVNTIEPVNITFSDGKTLSVNITNKVINWMAGFLTPKDKGDDSFKVNGTVAGMNREGKSYSYTSTDVVTSPDCKLPVSGTIKIIEGEKEGTVKFGDAGTTTCPTKLTYTTKDGKSFDVAI